MLLQHAKLNNKNPTPTQIEVTSLTSYESGDSLQMLLKMLSTQHKSHLKG